jgi:hypothetical protein
MGKFHFNKTRRKIEVFLFFRKRSVRIDYIVKNLSSNKIIPPGNSVFGKFMNDCISYPIRSVYLTEPRLSNKEIYDALKTAWRQANSMKF